MIQRIFLLALSLVASAAWAQLPPINTTSQPYVPLTGAQTAAPTARGTLFGATDEGYIPITLPFSFPYLGQSYTTVYADTNGFVSLGAPCTTSCLSPTSFPTAAAPNAIIAGMWEDNDMDSSSVIRWVSSPSEVTIEFSGMPFWDDFSSRATFQIKLSASGLFTVHHGAMTGSSIGGSVGFENAAGTVGANLIAGCTSSCTISNWVPNRLFQVGEPDSVDIGVASVTVQDFVRLPDDNLTFTVNGTFRNYGRTSTDGGFEWAAYLSRDRSLDTTATDGGADILVATGSAPEIPAVLNGVTADGGQAIVTITGPAATITPPATGEYYVLLHADSTDVVLEASEGNNVGSTATAFVQGVDLVAGSVSGPTTSTGGADAGVTFSFQNRGTSAPDAGVPFRVLLSADNVLDATDSPIASGVRAVTGGQTITDTLSFAMPANVLQGEFFYILQVNPPELGFPNGVIDEATAANNWVASSGKVNISRSDLVVESVEFLDPVTNLPTTTARFGEPVRLKVRYRNAGLAPAHNFRVGLILSTDSSLSLLSDVTVGYVTITTLAPSTTASEAIIDATLPLVDRSNTPYPTGNTYYVFGQADVTSFVYESNEQNNSQVVGPLRITAPGADLAVSAISAPTTAGVGEVLPITRGLRNLGNRDAPAVVYRYYASANDIITTDDLPLQIVDAAGDRLEGTVTLTAGAGDTVTELVRLPGVMQAGTYYIGAIIDPDRVVADDLEPANNALASRPVTVAPSSLRIINTALPDAVIGRPYSYRLSAAGEQGASNWTIDQTLGTAPQWLSLGASDGVLSGTPTGATGAQVVGLTVVVENAGRRAATRLALRVLPTTGGLEILTASLPAVVNSTSTQYDFQLGAAGGVPPYAWRVAQGTLPTGITLTSAGAMVGAPRNTPNGSLPITIAVSDAVGTTTSKAFTVRLIPAGAITFRTISLPDALVGQEYLQDIAVANQDGSMLAKPLVWRVTGAVPSGLAVTPQAELITLAGRATQAGTFTFTVTVEDNNGRSDSLDYTITVHPPRYRVVMVEAPEVLRPAEAVNIALSVTPAGDVRYRLVNGSLPPGLSVEAAGAITGTVAEEGSEGVWSFVIEAKDAAGISGVTPFTLQVERVPRVVGCASTPVDASVWFAALGLLLLARRRTAR